MSGTSPSPPGADRSIGAPVRTWRPRGVILTAALFTVVFAVGCVLGWFGLPPEIRDRFTAFQIGTLLFILAIMEIVMWLLAGSSVRTDADGLTIRNGWSRHRLGWDQVRRVRLRPGDPWATAELLDGERGPQPDPITDSDSGADSDSGPDGDSRTDGDSRSDGDSRGDSDSRTDGDSRGDSEPRTVMLFGLQGSEGAAARTAVRELNRYLDGRHGGH